VLGANVQVERVREGVSTFVYRVRFGRDALYLRIWPLVDESLESEAVILGVVVLYIGHRMYGDLFGFLRREAASYEFTTLLVEGMGDPAPKRA
jgi:hypothetical protein